MSNLIEPLESSIVRFYYANGNVAGAGLLVAERYVLTCAHVVAAALNVPENIQSRPEQLVQIDFPLLAPGYKVNAAVVFWLPVSKTASSEDMALLKLEAAPPANAKSVEMAPASDAWGHSLRVFGFPKGYADGAWATAILRGKTGKRWIQLDAKIGQARPLEKGFSGAPIWDEQLQAVVGITVAAEKVKDKDKQQSVAFSYMMPKYVLHKPLNFLRQQTIKDLLDAGGTKILGLIQRAYNLCRAKNAMNPLQRSIHGIIDELANTTADADQEEDKIVQFVAVLVLELDAQQIEGPRELLQQWGCRYGKDFDAAKAAMQELKVKRQEQAIVPHKPMLLVNIQEDASKESLSVEAWAVLDPEKYNAATMQGSRRLLFSPEGNDYAHLSEHDVAYDDLPILLESYLMELCGGLDDECDPSELTVYFVLPVSLLNKPWERLMLGDEPLGIKSDDCQQVILALQKRSKLGRFKANARWKRAWALKDDKAEMLAHQIFVDSDRLNEVGFEVAT